MTTIIFKASILVLAAALVMISISNVANASTLTTFQGLDGRGCIGNVETHGCGQCHAIAYHGGFYFLKVDGSALMYKTSDCSGSTDKVLSDDEWHCDNFSWNSVFIPCSA
ncbi:hypothetical protein Syun_008778 [Stephania yunnanensis]|uniref:Uncharacterized protein n=1 Tax=Stephania yunnanensis TaxID=152371 RepID=A0AAP0KF74_9MAGN